MTISNTTIALLIALISVTALFSSSFQYIYAKVFPDREVHISGHFSTSDQSITLSAYNYGQVAASFGSNIQCVFGLENAMGSTRTEDGVEVEFWTVEERIVLPEASMRMNYAPQFRPFESGNEQILCFGGLTYLDNSGLVEYFFLAIVPTEGHSFWPIEAIFTTPEQIELLYPRDVAIEH